MDWVIKLFSLILRCNTALNYIAECTGINENSQNSHYTLPELKLL